MNIFTKHATQLFGVTNISERAIMLNHVFLNDAGRCSVQTGDLETVWHGADPSTAASQIALLHDEILRLRALVAQTQTGPMSGRAFDDDEMWLEAMELDGDEHPPDNGSAATRKQGEP